MWRATAANQRLLDPLLLATLAGAGAAAAGAAAAHERAQGRPVAPMAAAVAVCPRAPLRAAQGSYPLPDSSSPPPDAGSAHAAPRCAVFAAALRSRDGTAPFFSPPCPQSTRPHACAGSRRASPPPRALHRGTPPLRYPLQRPAPLPPGAAAGAASPLRVATWWLTGEVPPRRCCEESHPLCGRGDAGQP